MLLDLRQVSWVGILRKRFVFEPRPAVFPDRREKRILKFREDMASRVLDLVAFSVSLAQQRTKRFNQQYRAPRGWKIMNVLS